MSCECPWTLTIWIHLTGVDIHHIRAMACDDTDLVGRCSIQTRLGHEPRPQAVWAEPIAHTMGP